MLQYSWVLAVISSAIIVKLILTTWWYLVRIIATATNEVYWRKFILDSQQFRERSPGCASPNKFESVGKSRSSLNVKWSSFKKCSVCQTPRECLTHLTFLIQVQVFQDFLVFIQYHYLFFSSFLFSSSSNNVRQNQKCCDSLNVYRRIMRSVIENMWKSVNNFEMQWVEW